MPLSDYDQSLADDLVLEGTPERVKQDVVTDMASYQDPDKAAQAHSIAKKNDVPMSVVEPELDDWQRQERATEIKEGVYGPELNKMLRNSDTAAIIQDDIENLRETEDNMTFLGATGGVLHSMILDIGTSVAGMAQAVFEKDEAPEDTIYGELSTPFSRAHKPAGEFFRNVGVSGAARSAEVMPQFDEPLVNTAVGGLKSAASFMTLMALTGGRALIPMSAQAAGLSYVESRQQGLKPSSAKGYAAVQGGIEYYTEKLPFDALMKGLGGDSFLTLIRNQLITEIPGEQVATLLQDLNDWVMLPENKDKPFESYIVERPSAALHTAVATVVGTATQTSLIHTANRLAGKMSDADISPEEDGAFTAAMKDAEQLMLSEQEQERLDTLITLAQSSKTNERAADIYREFLAGAGSDQSVYVPVDILNDLASEMDIPAAMLDQDDGLGGDVAIPMDVFMAEITGNEQLMEALRPHIKMGEDQLSSTEIEQGGDMTARRLIERAQAAADEKTEADAIWEDMQAQLIATGRVTQSEARLASQLYPAVAAIQAKRHGISVQEVYDRMNLTVEGPQGTPVGEGGTVMEQEAPAYKDAFVTYDVTRNAFLELLPEDARIDEVMAELDEFSAPQRRLMLALNDADWLGFDYPAQAISAIMSEEQENYELTPALKQALGRLVNGPTVMAQPAILKTDNPGGQWLQDKQAEAEANMAKGEESSRGRGLGTVTGWFPGGPVNVSVAILDQLEGVMGEHRTRDTSSGKLPPVLESMEKSGYDQSQPIFVTVNHKGEAFISEGNHRLAAAKALGIENIPVEIRYYNGGETAPGLMNPDSLTKPNLLAQPALLDKRRAMVEKLRECMMNTG